MSKCILDACCGSRMFWFDKKDPRAVFMDNRRYIGVACDGRTISVDPDVIGDFRAIPFEDESFQMVVFDPPHLIRAGDNSWLAQKYGKLDRETWRDDLRQGFAECFRVLKDGGVLIFKWNEDQIKVTEVAKAFPIQPIFGQRGGKTHWLVFLKNAEDEQAARIAELEKQVDDLQEALAQSNIFKGKWRIKAQAAGRRAKELEEILVEILDNAVVNGVYREKAEKILKKARVE